MTLMILQKVFSKRIVLYAYHDKTFFGFSKIFFEFLKMKVINNDLPQVYVRTPLIESVVLKQFTAGRRIFLKLENCQPSGSFKLRGVSAQVKHVSWLCARIWFKRNIFFYLKAKQQGYQKIVISSGGNAGLAAAYSALQLQMSCHVVVPRRTPRMIVDSLKEFEATVEFFGDSAQEVADRAEEISKLTPTALIYPSDHQLLWQGHSSMVDEIAEDLGDGVVPSLIVASCGGGGLVSGLVEGKFFASSLIDGACFLIYSFRIKVFENKIGNTKPKF